ncbi:MAG: 1-acyl-sn-glycerol-3-phosphate acyltransferase [Anaerolineales bacterium]
MKELTVKPAIEFRSPSPFLHWVGRSISKLKGWTIEYTVPDDPKVVIIFYPHTSNIDVLHAIPAAFAIGLKPNWLAKKELFWGPLRGFFLKLGAVPIDRHHKENKVDLIVDAIQQADRVVLALSPEGTRSRTEFWRSGFYHIANKLQIPIHFGFIDYPSKRIGVHPGFVPTGDIEADLEKIRAFYKDKRGKHPENVGPIKFRDK